MTDTLFSITQFLDGAESSITVDDDSKIKVIGG